MTAREIYVQILRMISPQFSDDVQQRSIPREYQLRCCEWGHEAFRWTRCWDRLPDCSVTKNIWMVMRRRKWALTVVHACPPVKPLPGAKMSCLAPLALIPSMAAWSFFKTSEVAMSWGSLLMPNTTFSFVLNRRASSCQNSLNCSVVAARGSDVSPMTYQAVNAH